MIKINNLKHDARFKILKDRFIISFYILIIYLFLSYLHVGCPIRFFTGISCPGCGMTRAIFELLHFDLKTALYYHPLFFITPFMYFFFLFEAYFNPTLNKIIWAITIILFITVYIIRLFILHNDVVTIDIYQGIMIKLIHQIYVGGFK